MKRLFIVAAFCLVLLTGCNKSTDFAVRKPAQTNNFGTQAVDIPSSIAPDSKLIENDENDNLIRSNTASAEEKESSEKSESGLPSSSTGSDSESISKIDVDVEIKEKMFIAQINDIYLNAEDYLGKTIKYEGVFDVYTWEEEQQTYYSVIRYGPGCCGNDGNVGFEVVWDGGYPEKNDWVEVIGTLEAYEENGWQYLRLNLSSLTVLTTRGEEYVAQ